MTEELSCRGFLECVSVKILKGVCKLVETCQIWTNYNDETRITFGMYARWCAANDVGLLRTYLD